MPIKLTEELIRAFQGFVEWILDMPLTPQQSADLRNSMIQEWSKNKRQSHELVITSLNIYDGILKSPANIQEYSRQQIQPNFIAGLRKEVPQNQFARAIVGAYDTRSLSPSPKPRQPVATATRPSIAKKSGTTAPPTSAQPTIAAMVGQLLAAAISGLTTPQSSPQANPSPRGVAKSSQGNPILSAIDLDPSIDQALYAIDPQAALMEQQQKRQQNLILRSNISAMDHETAMKIIGNIR